MVALVGALVGTSVGTLVGTLVGAHWRISGHTRASVTGGSRGLSDAIEVRAGGASVDRPIVLQAFKALLPEYTRCLILASSGRLVPPAVLCLLAQNMHHKSQHRQRV